MSQPNCNFVLETERLIGRKWRVEDAEDAFVLYSDPEVMRFLGGGGKLTPNVETQRENLAKIVDKYKDSPYGAWAMRLRDSGELAAVILLKALPGSENIEVGWHLPRAHWGHGYATEGGRAALDYGFSELRLKEIFAVVSPENTGSIKVTQRLGMTCLGQTTDYYELELNLYRSPAP